MKCFCTIASEVELVFTREVETGSIKLKNVSESIMEIFEMTGFVDILNIE